jgi:hypothetical protein
MTVVIARMMGPTEFGVSVLGASAFLILEAIRELASVNYLQQKELTRDKINSAFMVSLTVTGVLTTMILLLAHPIATLYGEPRLASYIRVVTIGFTLGPFMQPMYALWSRELAFRTIAGMDVLAAVTTAVASITLVALGFSYMGLAWASAISGVIGVSVALWLSRRELANFPLPEGTAKHPGVRRLWQRDGDHLQSVRRAERRRNSWANPRPRPAASRSARSSRTMQASGRRAPVRTSTPTLTSPRARGMGCFSCNRGQRQAFQLA